MFITSLLVNINIKSSHELSFHIITYLFRVFHHIPSELDNTDLSSPTTGVCFFQNSLKTVVQSQKMDLDFSDYFGREPSYRRIP